MVKALATAMPHVLVLVSAFQPVSSFEILLIVVLIVGLLALTGIVALIIVQVLKRRGRTPPRIPTSEAAEP